MEDRFKSSITPASEHFTVSSTGEQDINQPIVNNYRMISNQSIDDIIIEYMGKATVAWKEEDDGTVIDEDFLKQLIIELTKKIKDYYE